MLKKELEEQNERLVEENENLRSALQDFEQKLLAWEQKIDEVLVLQDSFMPFQSAVENWLGIVRENLEAQSGRIGFVEERAERLEKDTDKLELYYRGLTETTRRFARHLKIFQRKIEMLTGAVGSLTERAEKPKGFRALWVRWRDLQ